MRIKPQGLTFEGFDPLLVEIEDWGLQTLSELREASGCDVPITREEEISLSSLLAEAAEVVPIRTLVLAWDMAFEWLVDHAPELTETYFLDFDPAVVRARGEPKSAVIVVPGADPPVLVAPALLLRMREIGREVIRWYREEGQASEDGRAAA